MRTVALIPAAGAGTRMRKTPAKQFLPLAGKPLLVYALERVQASPLVHAIVLVVPPQKREECWREIVEPYRLSKVERIVGGGATRQESVYKGLQAIDPATEWVLIHDGVRPFLPTRTIAPLLEAAQESGAAILALPERETVKRIAREGYVLETLNRQEIWRVQTPQVFRYALLQEAFRHAFAEHYTATDEATLIERLGVRVRVLPGSPFNIKITTPEDLFVAEALLQQEPSSWPDGIEGG
ncbi:MAG: 2-C-methyl-D-erythritol 4-phosphate cytidylyltransferase [Nitrospinota bacterium]|nr:MAG: 2-C-methyl-D-erythritol 4-phosphate cytidylyltransferase [Nitrospinota bacterium]